MPQEYNAAIITCATIFNDNSESLQKTSSKNMSDVMNFIAEGYEIVSAVPTSTNQVANITYILRKKINEKEK